MNELLADTKSIVLALIGAIMALMAWFGKRQVARIDSLESKAVTREELASALKQMRDDRFQMHMENREELRYIRSRVDVIVDRQ